MTCQCGHAGCALPPAPVLPVAATRPPMPDAIIAVDEAIIAVG